MAKYLVLYTISDDSKRKQFVIDMNKIGFNPFEDQSTLYGSYTGIGKRYLVDDLKKLSMKLDLDDKVDLFFAYLQKNAEPTIKHEAIKQAGILL